MRGACVLLALVLWPAAAWAGLSEQQLGDAIAGRPTLLIPADFNCSGICGPALSIAAGALNQTGLKAGQDYSLVVVGIDANDGTDAARQFVSGQVGGPGVSVLTGSGEAIDALLQSIGYRF